MVITTDSDNNDDNIVDSPDLCCYCYCYIYLFGTHVESIE